MHNISPLWFGPGLIWCGKEVDAGAVGGVHGAVESAGVNLGCR